MARYSVVEAKNNLSALIDAAQSGGDVVITRHGKPAVKMVPVDPVVDIDPEWAARRDAEMARLAKLRASMPFSPVSSVDIIRQMRDEGP
ncbi:MAG: type II toxin-antitoxin system prevent-host-death family antitoxin [Alphaproteobacteria bacterium]|nr:type II toxin-antitoxin system prevent-host-death family antitoxin [Alphaproteobacteria bacterium]